MMLTENQKELIIGGIEEFLTTNGVVTESTISLRRMLTIFMGYDTTIDQNYYDNIMAIVVEWVDTIHDHREWNDESLTLFVGWYDELIERIEDEE